MPLRQQRELEVRPSLGCNCRFANAPCSALAQPLGCRWGGIRNVALRGCNCSRSAAIQEYPAAIGDAWLQLQNTRLQLELLGCNCGLRIRHAGIPPKEVCRYTEARAANPGEPDVLFTPLECNVWLKLQVLVMRSRGCKRYVWPPWAAKLGDMSCHAAPGVPHLGPCPHSCSPR